MGTRAARYDLIREFQSVLKDDLSGVADPNHIDTSSSWALAVVQLGRPQSFSRRTFQSIGSVVEGAFARREKPFIITGDCHHLTIQNTKRSHTKTLQASLRHSGTNYLDQNVVLPGDWIFAWCWNNLEDQKRVLGQVSRGEAANGFGDGLKFVGRVHNIHKTIALIDQQKGTRDASYSLQAIGFEELDTQFFYDFALATASGVKNEIRTFMAQLGLDFSKWAEQEQMRAGNIKDNADKIIETLVDIIIGKGVASTVNVPIERSTAAARQINLNSLPAQDLKLAPQANKEAPFAYLVPVTVAKLLGRDVAEKSKAGVFGYADVLDTLIGVQRFESPADNVSTAFVPDLFYPELNPGESTRSRKKTTVPLKGTFLPVNPSFVNQPLFQILQQFLNPAINELYTALRTDENGAVVPTLVARQIPFSTESIRERPEFPLTRFMSLPRWVIDPTMVTVLSIGRSNATRTNMIHVYGDAVTYAGNKSVTNQMVRNPPIFDASDIARSGIRPMLATVSCALTDQVRKDGARVWMEMISDIRMGSCYSLNGSVTSKGIQSPIAEGDNMELDGMVYHIESITHDCTIANGKKAFTTILEISNGMPADQSEATPDFPTYPGMRPVSSIIQKPPTLPTMEAPEDSGIPTDEETTNTTGDPNTVAGFDPGTTRESSGPGDE
jgi:hypothetical protein